MTEHSEQAALLQWASTRTGAIPELARLFAIPNGGYRAKSTAARLKAEGVKPGVPDLFLPVPRWSYHGLWIEMKHGKNHTSKEQDDWLAWLHEQGYDVTVCHHWEDAAKMIEAYLGIPVRKRTEFFT